MKYDPEYRDSTGSGPPNDIATVKPGEHIPLWKGEDIEPMFTPQSNPLVEFYFQTLATGMERLSGSSAIYGAQEPGVRTGYHASLQISQSEHLDEKLEAHFVAGAVNRATIVLEHIKAMNEPLSVHYRFTDKRGFRSGSYIRLDPKKLEPLPEIDAAVRKPRPIDYGAALRDAMTASQDRGGPNTPLLDDDTIRERLLGEDAPDVIQQKINIQGEQKKLIESGVLSQKIQERMNLLMAKDAATAVGEGEGMAADPALLQAAAQLNASGATEQGGGISPGTGAALEAGMAANGIPQPAPPPPAPTPSNVQMPVAAPSMINGQGGGTPPGRPQPEQQVALALNRARGMR